MVWKSLLATACAFGLGSMAALYAAGPPIGRGMVEEIAVTKAAIPLNRNDPAATKVGRLVYLGGLELKSKDRRFGGISGLLWEADCKRLLAVSDTGVWLILVPLESGERLQGLGPVWIGPVLDEAGAAPRNKTEADAESLNRMGEEIFLWFEQDHRAQRYRGISACRPETLATPSHAPARPPAIQAWPPNGGVEAAAVLGNDTLLLSESLPVAGGRAAVRWNPETGSTISFAYAAPSGFDPTEMAARNPDVADGKMLVLHRRFSPLTGVAAMLGEADMTDAQPSATIKPQELALLKPPLAVDNMEAMAVRAEGDRRIIYMVSDDNFNALQKTILLKFELVDEGR